MRSTYKEKISYNVHM